MKLIKFPELKLVGIVDKDVIYELSKGSLNTPPQGGFTSEDMRSRIKVLGIIAERPVSDTLELEDADYEVYKNCVNAMKWAICDEAIVKFTDAVNLKLKDEETKPVLEPEAQPNAEVSVPEQEVKE